MANKLEKHLMNKGATASEAKALARVGKELGVRTGKQYEKANRQIDRDKRR